MKVGLLIIPFLAIFIVALCAAIGSSYPELHWVNQVGWGLGAALVALWISLDFEGFKRFFSRKGAKYGAASGINLILGLLIIIGLAFLTTKPRFNKSLDITRSQANTLTEQSIKIIEKLNQLAEPVEIEAFFESDTSKSAFTGLLHLYENAGARFTIRYYNPRENPQLVTARELTNANTVIFKRGSREARITNFTEEKFTNALIKILKEGKKQIYFTTGHGEAKLDSKEMEGYFLIHTELKNNQYEVETIDLIEKGGVPPNANLVVIAGPAYDIKPEEVSMLKNYLKAGGRLLTMVNALVSVPHLNSVLEDYGLRLDNDFLLLGSNDPRARFLGQSTIAIVSEFDSLHAATSSFASNAQISVLMPFARSIVKLEKPDDFPYKVDLIAKTVEGMARIRGVNKKSDLEKVKESDIETGSFAVVGVATGKTESAELAQKENHKKTEQLDAHDSPVADKEIRVVAVGSAAFASNSGAQNPENLDLFLNLSSYLLQDEDYIAIRPHRDEVKSHIDVTSPLSQLELVFYSFIYPFLFLGSGLLYWFVRRRS